MSKNRPQIWEKISSHPEFINVQTLIKAYRVGFFLETLEYVLSNSRGSPGIHQSKINSRIFSKKALKMSFKNRGFSKSNECLKNEIVAAADLNNEVLASELIF